MGRLISTLAVSLVFAGSHAWAITPTELKRNCAEARKLNSKGLSWFRRPAAQIAAKRADQARQELEIARIRGQIEDSQISSRFDKDIQGAPNDQSARILSAAKEAELARMDLERTIKQGRIETNLRNSEVDQQYMNRAMRNNCSGIW